MLCHKSCKHRRGKIRCACCTGCLPAFCVPRNTGRPSAWGILDKHIHVLVFLAFASLPSRKRPHSTELAYKAVGKLLEIVKVCSVTNNDVLIVFQKKAKDFKDCLVATCAKSIRCNCIVTRNKKDFEEFSLPFSLLPNSCSKSHSPYKPIFHFSFHILKYGLLRPGLLLP